MLYSQYFTASCILANERDHKSVMIANPLTTYIISGLNSIFLAV